MLDEEERHEFNEDRAQVISLLVQLITATDLENPFH